MKNLFCKISILVFVFAAFSVVLTAQPPMHANKRMETLKKMKLLEILDLDEKKANQLLVKYDSWNDKFNKLHTEMDDIQKKLTNALEENKSDDAIEKINEEFLNKLESLHKLMNDRMGDFQKFFTNKEFAKFIIFEKEFPARLQREMMKRFKDRRGGPELH